MVIKSVLAVGHPSATSAWESLKIDEIYSLNVG